MCRKKYLLLNMKVGDAIDIFLWIFEILFGALHVLMMIFLILKRRKKVQIYRSFYYTVFIIIGVVDIIYLINVSKFNTFLYKNLVSERYRSKINKVSCSYTFLSIRYILSYCILLLISLHLQYRNIWAYYSFC